VIAAGLGVDSLGGLENVVVVDDSSFMLVVADNGGLTGDLLDQMISWIAVTA